MSISGDLTAMRLSTTVQTVQMYSPKPTERSPERRWISFGGWTLPPERSWWDGGLYHSKTGACVRGRRDRLSDREGNNRSGAPPALMRIVKSPNLSGLFLSSESFIAATL